MLGAPRPVVLSDTLSGTLVPELRFAAGDRLGIVNLPLQADEAARTFAAGGSAGELPSFVAAVARAAGAVDKELSRGDRWINFVSPQPGSDFPEIPFHRLSTKPTSEDQRLLEGATVLIGEGFSGSGDLHVGACGKLYRGMEINAHALATVLDRRTLHRLKPGAEAGLTALTFLPAYMFLVRLPSLWGLFAVSALSVAWIAVSLAAFGGKDLLLPLAGPSAAPVVAAIAFHLTRSLIERRRRLMIEQTFGRYLTEPIRDFLLASPAHQRLGGWETDATVLFVDLRDSVRLAAGRNPAEVMEDLNRFLTAAAPAVQRNGGLLYRYTGDGFLAVFGAPVPVPGPSEHATAAVIAGVEVAEATRALGFWAGCGIHSGRLVYGNLGAADRPDFTVIGETVNLAARLEKASKKLEASIVVSEATYQRLSCSLPDTWNGPEQIAIDGMDDLIVVRYLPVQRDEDFR